MNIRTNFSEYSISELLAFAKEYQNWLDNSSPCSDYYLEAAISWKALKEEVISRGILPQHDTTSKKKKKVDTEKRVRSACFTSFDPTPPIFDPASMKYLCFQGEIAPKTKKKHWQGYVEFKAQHRYAGACKALHIEKWHVEPAMGTPWQARHYCLKPDDLNACNCSHCAKARKDPLPWSPFQEFGRIPKNTELMSKKSKSADIVDAILNGNTVEEIAIDNPHGFFQHHRSIEALAEKLAIKRSWPTFVVWLQGPAGCGKDRMINIICDYLDLSSSTKRCGQQGPYLYQYTGQKVIVTPEWNPTPEKVSGCWSPSGQLDMFDRYEMTVQTFGKVHQLVPYLWFLTTNYDYTLTPQMNRRIPWKLKHDENSDYFIDDFGIRRHVWQPGSGWAHPGDGIKTCIRGCFSYSKKTPQIATDIHDAL